MYFKGLQQVQTKNLDKLRKAVLDRPKGTPLVTVSNHSSCIDDPVIFGMCINSHVSLDVSFFALQGLKIDLLF